jgi:hypothetical protein
MLGGVPVQVNDSWVRCTRAHSLGVSCDRVSQKETCCVSSFVENCLSPCRVRPSEIADACYSVSLMKTFGVVIPFGAVSLMETFCAVIALGAVSLMETFCAVISLGAVSLMETCGAVTGALTSAFAILERHFVHEYAEAEICGQREG